MNSKHKESGFICSDCARDRKWKWPKIHVATAHEGECPDCYEIKTLTSHSDWIKPNEKELKSWD